MNSATLTPGPWRAGEGGQNSGKTHPRKGWAKPLGRAVLGIVGIFVVAIIVGIVIGVLSA